MRVRKLLLIVPRLLAFPLQAQELRVAELASAPWRAGLCSRPAMSLIAPMEN